MGRSADRATLADMILSGRIEQYRNIFVSVSSAVLAEVPLFSKLDRRHLELIAGSVDDRKVESGAVLSHQGDSEREFMVILDGTARVERDGHVLAHLQGGDFCGEMSLIDGQPRSATIVTESPCVLLVIDGRSFRKLLDSVPGLERQILITLCQRLRSADAALAALN